MIKFKVIAIAGPTASGKTQMAVDLAEKIDGEIVSADSRLVYKGFNIAAAKPTKEEQHGIPHHLIDIVEPETDYSVGNYYEDAKIAISDIVSRGKTPIIAGGTGLYLRVLLENYSLPKVEANPDLRKELELLPREKLLEEIKIKDLNAFERLYNSNKRRIVRAVEVMRLTGKAFSEVSSLKEPEYDVDWKMPSIKSRTWLYDRINKRVDLMFENGIIDETKNLLKKHGRIKNITDTIGYKEIISYLDGNSSLEEAVEKLKQHTRNYAKRQLTWFRRNPALEKLCRV